MQTVQQVQTVQQIIVSAVLRNAVPRAAVAGAALAVALFGAGVRPAAAAEAAWCLVDYEGNNHCYYNSFAECHQAVFGGSRGFCNVNPSAAPAAASTAAPSRHR